MRSQEARDLARRVAGLSAELTRFAQGPGDDSANGSDLDPLGEALAEIYGDIRQLPRGQGRRFIPPLMDLLARLDALDKANRPEPVAITAAGRG